MPYATLPTLAPSPADLRRQYVTRLAESEADLHAAQSLRFQVFNLELNEGLDGSYATGLDADPFDECCDHILIEHQLTGAVVGTYRLQTGWRAASGGRGYYSEGEFDLTPFESCRDSILELGRACVHGDHRTAGVLNLLWRAIVQYAQERGARLLIGCSSLTSQDPALGAAMFNRFRETGMLAPAHWQTLPRADFALPPHLPLAGPCPPPPRLLRAYLAVGARICGAPRS